MTLQRKISTPALLFSAVGGIVGSGWLFGPMYAAQVAGPAAILSWIIGGLLMMVIAFTFAELGAAFPVSGGVVRFADLSYGPLMGFSVGWMVWLSSVVVAPLETLALLQYAGNYIPGLVHKVNDVTVLTGRGIGAAAAIMLLLCFLSWQGATFYNRLSSVIVAIKLIVPILVVIALLSLDFHLSNFTQIGGFAPYGLQAVLAALPYGGVIFSFIGYSAAIQLAGEASKPKFAIPFAVIGSLVLCIVLYALLQVAFIGALPAASVSHGWHLLSFKDDSGPFAGIFALLGLTWMVWVIYADAIISPFGTAFIYTATTARVNYAMTKIGFFPQVFTRLNRQGVPGYSIILNFCVGLFLFLPFPTWQNMVSFIISCFVISFSTGPLALIALRYTHADTPRAFRVPCAFVSTFIAFYICNLIVYWTGWQTVYHLLIAIGIGLAFYVYRQYRMSRIDKLPADDWRKPWWLIPYFIGLGIISYLGVFGGGHGVIKFGMDFVIIGLFSAWIYYLAVQCVKKRILPANE